MPDTICYVRQFMLACSGPFFLYHNSSFFEVIGHLMRDLSRV
jgi:hypothetical protein